MTVWPAKAVPVAERLGIAKPVPGKPEPNLRIEPGENWVPTTVMATGAQVVVLMTMLEAPVSGSMVTKVPSAWVMV